MPFSCSPTTITVRPGPGGLLGLAMFLVWCFASLSQAGTEPFQPQWVLVPAGAPVANPWLYYLPYPPTYVPAPAPLPPPAPVSAPTPATLPQLRPYTVRQPVPPELKRQMMRMAMPMMTGVLGIEMPDAMNWFAHKYRARAGLGFDDVVESLNLRANQLNFKHVGANLMWKDFQAVLGDQGAPRMEVHSYCDIAVARELLKISPEFLVFLPCRIAVMEDGEGNIWVMMLDWNMDWVAGMEASLGLTPELVRGARELHDKMDNIMRAAANGEW